MVSGRQSGRLPIRQSGTGNLPADRSRSIVRRETLSARVTCPMVQSRGSTCVVIGPPPDARRRGELGRRRGDLATLVSTVVGASGATVPPAGAWRVAPARRAGAE